MAWTTQQQEAIETRNCGLIVSAAAGSGKTSVLVERLLRILMEDDPEKQVPADRMIVVTFTNDAAAEMKARLTQALEEQLQKHPENRWLYQQQILLQSAHICTISSFCFELVRDNLTNSGITSGFRILGDTESRLMASKAADQVLNRWHEERCEDMTLLWNCFCEKNDTPIERILLELHSFLGSVPFREQWQKTVMQQLGQPLSSSIYHKAFMQQLYQLTQDAVSFAQEAVAIASGLYDSVKDNTVLSWVEEDCSCLEQLFQQLHQSEVRADILLAPFLEKQARRNRKQFPRKKKSIAQPEDYEIVKQLRTQYTACEEEILTLIQTVLPYEEMDLEQHRKLVPIFMEMEAELSECIWAEKVQQNALGFDDGERLALQLLSHRMPDGKIQPSPLAKEMSAYYRLIMIDEYQDSNNKQDDIFKLLSHNCIDPKTGELQYGDNVFLVGDVKQSIYRFRLANPQNFVKAVRDASDGSGVCHHIALNRNFRSVPAILHFVNFLCGNLMSPSCGDIHYNESESLLPGTAISDVLPLEEQKVHVAVLHETPEKDIQIQYVIRQIQRMVRTGTAVAEKDGTTRPCQYRDFCILLRNHTQCHQFSHALEQAGIPVQSPEEKGYLQAREISLLLDMLRVIDNPLLDTPLAAVMLSPMFWFTAQELLQIRMTDKKTSLYAGLCQAIGVLPTESLMPPIADDVLLKKCRHLYDTLQQLRQESALLTLEELIRRIYDTTDFLSVMQLTQDGEKKRANLQLLLQYARQYEETHTGFGGVSGFLRYIDWLLESGNDFQQVASSVGLENVVSVKTMHRSKGLEYPFVFLGNLEVHFSTEDKRKAVLFSDNGMVGFRIKDPETYTSAKTLLLLVIEQENERCSLSEELRLLYVALTRSKQQLFLPLLAEKIRLTSRDYLAQFAASISSDGTLPVTMVRSAASMAHWIWMCLLLQHDSELDQIISLPEQTWQTPQWTENLQIQYESDLPEPFACAKEEMTAEPEPVPAMIADIQQMVSFQYQSADTERASLLSVSAVQELEHDNVPIWKRPKFLQESGRLTGAERGTAVHTFFQYANFHNAEQDAAGELQRLSQYGFLTRAQAAVVNPSILTAFFSDPLYSRIKHSSTILREKKFLVRCADLKIPQELEHIMQQYCDSDSMLKGIIDLAFLEHNAYVLVDYKTDAVTDASELVERYWGQLALYRAALTCVTGYPVRQCYFYSTHLKRSIEISSGEGDSYDAEFDG